MKHIIASLILIFSICGHAQQDSTKTSSSESFSIMVNLGFNAPGDEKFAKYYETSGGYGIGIGLQLSRNFHLTNELYVSHFNDLSTFNLSFNSKYFFARYKPVRFFLKSGLDYNQYTYNNQSSYNSKKKGTIGYVLGAGCNVKLGNKISFVNEFIYYGNFRPGIVYDIYNSNGTTSEYPIYPNYFSYKLGLLLDL